MQQLSFKMEALASRNLRFSDCVCPVCLSVLIEPVTMPCEHELCMPCFKRNVEGANFTCPLCRKRISTWVRRATKTNTLINTKRWCQIQKAFPEKVQKRLHGVDDDQSSDEELVATPPISEPGAIHDEYLKEMHRVKKEQERIQQLEEDASSQLIQQLTEEEEEKERQRRRVEIEDEAYAHNLSSDFGQDKALDSPAFNKMLCGAFKGGTSSKQSSAANLLLDQYLVKTPKQQELLASPSSTSCFFLGNSRASSQLSELGKDDHLPSLPFAEIKEESSDSSVLVISPYEPSWPLASSRDSSSIDGILTDDQSSRSSIASAKGDFNKRSSSATSEDSISQELVHFKPIHSSPCTPPRTLPNGKLASKPRLVVTVPCNLTTKMKEQRSAPEIPQCSPGMRKKLLELAEERRKQVKALSKSTSTGKQLLAMNQGQEGSSPLRSSSANGKSESALSSEVSPSHQSTFPPDSGFESDESLNKSANKRNFQPLKSVVKPLRSKGKAISKVTKQSKKNERSSSALNSSSSNLITWLKMQQSTDQDSSPTKRSRSCIEDDYLLALKLQEGFDMEAKYRLNAVRSKEVDGEYSLRKKKRSRVA